MVVNVVKPARILAAEAGAARFDLEKTGAERSMVVLDLRGKSVHAQPTFPDLRGPDPLWSARPGRRSNRARRRAAARWRDNLKSMFARRTDGNLAANRYSWP